MSETEAFCKEVRALGVYVSSSVCVGRNGEEIDVPYIDFRDTTKAQEKKIVALAKKYGLTVDVGDKGVVFK